MAEKHKLTWAANGKTQQQNLPQTLETPEQQEKDAQMIFKRITSGSFENYDQAEIAIAMIYGPDLTISLSGISRALKMLKRHYEQPKSET